MNHTSHRTLLRPYGLTTEQLNEPLGVEERNPRLSWKLDCDRRGAAQTAFRITAANRAADLEDPTRLIGQLANPLLSPTEAEREGYVPNVTYSCGALAHGQRLIVPYGCADTSIGIAVIDLPQLLEQIAGHRTRAHAIS